jgi:hypothetical protein
VVKYLIRTIWRLVVLVLGVGLAYMAAFIAFPYLDKRLPFFFALLVVYIGLAYFGLPALLRFWRVLIKPNHIPLYVTTRDGIPSDPVNIAVVARSKHHLIRSMKKAGWHTADKATLANTIREGWAMLLNKPYPTAPFSALYLFNRPFDIGFQIPYGKNGSPRHRHHVRFWELIEPSEKDHGHFRFWMRHFRRFLKRKKTVWIGAAIDDIHIYGVRWYNLQITHRTHPKHTRERDLIIDSLEKNGQIKYVSEAQAGEPFAMRSQQIGNSFVSDGRLKIVELS